ncbi:unnamed protein product [Caenorhabditis bovis]|uniref:Phosphatidylcholine transfer protein n=1 Tax=Caenorhabditis bovis TaxID=2654633 RepID=A0A8S1E8N6_9PELO|nr:unnamed protein product [Caenorhabditis bovis]
MNVHQALEELMLSQCGVCAIMVTDHDGGVVLTVGEIPRHKNGTIAGHLNSVSQGRKILLGKLGMAYYLFESSQLVVHTIGKYYFFIYATENSCTGGLIDMREKLLPVTKTLQKVCPAIDVRMLNRNWGAFLFRQIIFIRNLRHHFTRFRTKTLQYSSNYVRNDRKIFWTFASVAGFSFQKHGISDERIKECEDCEYEFKNCKKPDCGWELLYEEPDMLAFRRRIDGPYEMYEYKCVGTYRDISPRTFLDAQNDINYRKEWDENILSIEVVREEDENELIRWVSKFPYPLYPREYVYVRRTWVSDDEKYAVIDSEAVPPEVFASTSKYNVRVSSYSSRMSIRAHKDWESHGVDYILTYADNPEANIPRYVYNWMVNKGGPYFLRQVHKAAREIEASGRQVRSATEKAVIGKNRRLEERKRILAERQITENTIREENSKEDIRVETGQAQEYE